ncbi:hypothetical protein [Geodermatophilus sp. SYSU D01105]
MVVPAVAVAASCVLWAWVYRSLVRHPLDFMALTLYYLALQLLWRPIQVVTGLDTPFPTELFLDRDVAGLVVHGQAVVAVFLVALWAGARFLTPLVGPAKLLFPMTRGPLSPRALLLLALGAGALALAVTALLWIRYGGPAGLLNASKVEHDVAESRALRSIPMLAALFAVAAFFAPDRGAWLQRLLSLGLVALNGYLSWTWGARDIPVISAIALLAGSLVFSSTGHRVEGRSGWQWLRDPRWRRRFFLVPVVALLLAFSLRTARDTVLWGNLAPTLEDQTTVRQVAVATNNTFYDSLLLILDDWPDEFDFRGGEDFIEGTVAAVPSTIAGEQEPFVTPAVRLAQTYIDRNNGFPSTPVGDWYLNLGLLGVALGGLLSGVIVRAGQLAFRRFSRDPLVWGFSLVFAIRIFPGGLWAVSMPKWVAIGVPVIAVAVAINLFLRRSSSDVPDAPPPAARPASGELPEPESTRP